jgi:lipoic acid synthetase
MQAGYLARDCGQLLHRLGRLYEQEVRSRFLVGTRALEGSLKTIDPARFTKSSIMVGVGETDEEIEQTMRDLRAVGVDFLTLGQYLQPTKQHLAVESFMPPDAFKAWEERGLELGFSYVASGPLVRSSYKAGEFFIRDFLQKRAVQPVVLPA